MSRPHNDESSTQATRQEENPTESMVVYSACSTLITYRTRDGNKSRRELLRKELNAISSKGTYSVLNWELMVESLDAIEAVSQEENVKSAVGVIKTFLGSREDAKEAERAILRSWGHDV